MKDYYKATNLLIQTIVSPVKLEDKKFVEGEPYVWRRQPSHLDIREDLKDIEYTRPSIISPGLRRNKYENKC